MTLYAAWKPQGVELPRPEQDGFYFDGWYVDKECETRAEIVEGQYIPSENTTLYGQWISKVIPEIGWYQDKDEPVETRRIYARWSKDSKVKSYAVYLLLCGNDDNKYIVHFDANTLPDGAELLGDGGISVKTPKDDSDMVIADMTEIFKQNTDGGVYTFTVQPQIEGTKPDVSGSKEIIALARPENLRWDETRTVAMWDSVEGADYYLMWLYSGGTDFYSATGWTASEICGLKQHNDVLNCVIVGEEKVDLSGAINEAGNAEYEVIGYSENIEKYYTPLYEHIRSETN